MKAVHWAVVKAALMVDSKAENWAATSDTHLIETTVVWKAERWVQTSAERLVELLAALMEANWVYLLVVMMDVLEAALMVYCQAVERVKKWGALTGYWRVDLKDVCWVGPKGG